MTERPLLTKGANSLDPKPSPSPGSRELPRSTSSMPWVAGGRSASRSRRSAAGRPRSQERRFLLCRHRGHPRPARRPGTRPARGCRGRGNRRIQGFSRRWRPVRRHGPHPKGHGDSHRRSGSRLGGNRRHRPARLRQRHFSQLRGPVRTRYGWLANRHRWRAHFTRRRAGRRSGRSCRRGAR